MKTFTHNEYRPFRSMFPIHRPQVNTVSWNHHPYGDPVLLNREGSRGRWWYPVPDTCPACQSDDLLLMSSLCFEVRILCPSHTNGTSHIENRAERPSLCCHTDRSSAFPIGTLAYPFTQPHTPQIITHHRSSHLGEAHPDPSADRYSGHGWFLTRPG